MKVLMVLAMMAAGTPVAGAAVRFGPAATCPTYCTGFTTDNPAHALDWLNAAQTSTTQPRTLLSMNGVEYAGDTTATLVSTIGTHSHYRVSGLLRAANGSTLSVSYWLEYWTTRVVSGRDAGRTVPHRAVGGGELTLP